MNTDALGVADPTEMVDMTPSVMSRTVEDSVSLPSAPAVTAFVLLPTEGSFGTWLDAEIKQEALRLVQLLGRRITLVGIAPQYPLLVRMIPGGVAQNNRLADAKELQRRCDEIKAHVLSNCPTTVPTIEVTVVASGTGTVAEQILAACAEVHTDDGPARVGHVYMVPDSYYAYGYSNAERLIQAIQTRPLKERVPVTLLRSPTALKPDSVAKRTAKRRIVVCFIDMDAMDDLVPAHVMHAVLSVGSGDGIILQAPISMPDVGDATQLTSSDWTEKLKELMKVTSARLADTKRAVERLLKLRGVSDVTVGTATSEKHHMQGIVDAVETFVPAVLAVSPNFKRQWAFRRVWESLRGAEYERVLRANPFMDIIVV